MKYSLILIFVSLVGLAFSAAPQGGLIHEKKDTLEKKAERVSLYDTSSIFTENWLVNITFSYADNGFDKSARLPLTDSIRSYAFPIEKETTSGFGRRHGSYHKGIDIPLITGEPVVAAFDGKVRYATWNSGGFGNLVIIRHTNGLETYYAHLSKLKVKPNQLVKAGQVIGLGGSTGRSYSPHLHFEIRYHDVAFDPERIFDTEHYCLRQESVIVADLLQKTNATQKQRLNHDHLADGAVYAIQSGDTLSKIAARNGTTVEELCELNDLDRNSILRIGQQIRVN